jgi:hypothetical protein
MAVDTEKVDDIADGKVTAVVVKEPQVDTSKHTEGQ